MNPDTVARRRPLELAGQDRSVGGDHEINVRGRWLRPSATSAVGHSSILPSKRNSFGAPSTTRSTSPFGPPGGASAALEEGSAGVTRLEGSEGGGAAFERGREGCDDPEQEVAASTNKAPHRAVAHRFDSTAVYS